MKIMNSETSLSCCEIFLGISNQMKVHLFNKWQDQIVQSLAFCFQDAKIYPIKNKITFYINYNMTSKQSKAFPLNLVH